MKDYINKLNSAPMLWVSGLFLLASFIIEYILPLSQIEFSLPFNPAWVPLFISGIPLAYSAIINLMAKKITSPLLITIAMIAAVYIGDIFAAGEVAFIMAIGELLEDRTVEKAKKGIEKLLNLVPNQARLIIDEAESLLDPQDIKIGDIIRVLPGESFPADGLIIEGNTTVDQSIITGESLPVDKGPNDEVFTGTINRFGSVDIKVSKSFANSSLQKMIKLVEDAENHQAPTQKIVDKWAGYLVPLACIIAAITYLVLAFGFDQKADALVRAVTVLVVFCPCALALATPTSIMAAIGQATKNGVLIKSGEALEQMGKVNTVALDKTGTITGGKLKVSDIHCFDIAEDELISLIASVESRSEHPLGKAISQYARERQLKLAKISNFNLKVGKGVIANLDGRIIYCGNEKLITDEANLAIAGDINSLFDSFKSQGKALIIAADQERILGIIALADQLKDNSQAAIAALNAAGIANTVLLTGDNQQTADFIAAKVGISQVYASLLPQDKVAAVKELMQQNQVCMVGDGVNDAPALKTANVGIAMGTMGSDIAIDAADIAILGDDIGKISYIKKLSNATIFSIKFNIAMSMVINFGAIILSVMGLINPASGALVHNAGSVLVVLNAARLYDKKIDY